MYLFPLRPCGPGSRRVCSARLDEFLWLSGSGLGVCCLVFISLITRSRPLLVASRLIGQVMGQIAPFCDGGVHSMHF